MIIVTKNILSLLLFFFGLSKTGTMSVLLHYFICLPFFFISTTTTGSHKRGRKVGTGIHLEETGHSSNAFALVPYLLSLRGQ